MKSIPSAARIPDQEVVAFTEALAELMRVYQFRDRDQICCHDISVTQCYALEALIRNGPMRSSVLAQRLFLDRSTTSRVVNALTRKKYVERRPDLEDARAVQLRATAAGRALYQRIHREIEQQHRLMFADLDPEVRRGVIAVLRKLTRAAQSRFRPGTGEQAEFCGPCAEPSMR